MALYKKISSTQYFLRTSEKIGPGAGSVPYCTYLIWICIPENRWIWISVKSMRIRNTYKNSVILGSI